jgi:hypothetical protein
VLPPNTSLQKDAVLALTKSATVFISHLAAHANEQSFRKTINVQDVLSALKEVELDGLMEVGKVDADGKATGRLEREVEMYERLVGEKRKGYRERVKARNQDQNGNANGNGEAGGQEEQRAAKKVRRNIADDDEEQSALERQLNGDTTMETDGGEGPRDVPEVEDEPEEGADQDGEDGEDEDDEDEDDDDEQDEDEDEQDDDKRLAEAEDDLEVREETGRIGLAPDGRVEIEGSEDESD